MLGYVRFKRMKGEGQSCQTRVVSFNNDRVQGRGGKLAINPFCHRIHQKASMINYTPPLLIPFSLS